MPTITEGVDFDTVAREWRLKVRCPGGLPGRPGRPGRSPPPPHSSPGGGGRSRRAVPASEAKP